MNRCVIELKTLHWHRSTTGQWVGSALLSLLLMFLKSFLAKSGGFRSEADCNANLRPLVHLLCAGWWCFPVLTHELFPEILDS